MKANNISRKGTLTTLFIGALLFVVSGAYLSSCSVSQEIAAKSGALLWGENCSRCHNAPSPADFGDAQWELIGSHMRVRASLTAAETEKIIEFLKAAN